MTNWPELELNDTVLYQNDEGRPNRLVLARFKDGYSLRIDSILGDTRSAPPLTVEDLINIAARIAVEAREDGRLLLQRMQAIKEEE